jgi:cell pole-organizing protein PopZ
MVAPMSDAKSQPEPSMEEIIASISRIIAEDKRPGDQRTGESKPSGGVSAGAGEVSDVLELTQAVNEDGSVRHVTPRGQDGAEPAQSKAPASDAAAEVEPEPLRAGPAVEPRLDMGRGRIVSTATSGAAATAFAQLGALPRESRRQGELPLGSVERTLEELVRETLRPMLQTWLDEHLPGIVERLVREEIARVVGEAGLR